MESEKPAIVLLSIKSVVTCECSLTPYFYHVCCNHNIKNWSDVQLVEDENNDNSMSATKYNEQWRVEVERRRAKEQAKRWVSYSWLVMIELMVLGGGGHYTTVWQRQKEGVGATGVPAMPGPWAQV